MEQKSIIIIGAGVAGLSAGCYGQMNGYRMVGQWVEPGGGLPTAAMSGRNVIQVICKRDKKPFVAMVP